MLVLLAVCILANTFFVKMNRFATSSEDLTNIVDYLYDQAEEPQEILKMKQASTTMAKSNNVDLICPNPNWSCPGTQPCCFSSTGWRCCPYTDGTCCAGGLRCCPSGQNCIWGLWCQ